MRMKKAIKKNIYLFSVGSRARKCTRNKKIPARVAKTFFSMNEDFCSIVADLYSQHNASGYSSLRSSTNSLSSSGGGGAVGAGTFSSTVLGTSALSGDNVFCAPQTPVEIVRAYILPVAIKRFGKRNAVFRCVEIALVACEVRAAFIDDEFARDELGKGSARKARAYDFVQFVQQWLPFIGFSITPLSFKTNGTCEPIASVWYNTRRVACTDVHRLILPDSLQKKGDILQKTALGHTAPVFQEFAGKMPGNRYQFTLRVHETDFDEQTTRPLEYVLLEEFIPGCFEMVADVLEEKRCAFEQVACHLLDRDNVSVVLLLR